MYTEGIMLFFPISVTPDFNFFKILLLCAKVFGVLKMFLKDFQGPK